MTTLRDRVAGLSPVQRAALVARLRPAVGPGATAELPAGITPVARQGDVVTLSSTQERMWFLEQFAPGTSFQNMSGVARVPVRVDAAAFAECLDEVVRRHEILRTRFAMRADGPVGIVQERVTVPLEVLRGLSGQAREQAFADDACQPFDLSVAPLLRVTIVPHGASECFVQLTLHHLVSDGFSTGVFFAELGALYGARLSGTTADLPALPFQFADVSVRARSRPAAEGAADLAHWSRHLAGAPQQLTLPMEHPRPSRMTYRGARLPFPVEDGLVAQVRSYSRRQGVTPFVTMLTAFVVVLTRYAAQDEIVVGVPVANREEPGTGSLIGPFLNTLALRFALPGTATFATLLEQVNHTVRGGMEHQAVPFEHVLSAVAPARDPSRSPLFQVVFNFQADRSDAAGAPGIVLRDLPNGGCQVDLLLHLVTTGSGMTAHVDYGRDLYDPAFVQRLVDSYLTLLGAVVAGRDRPVAELPLITPAGALVLLQRAQDAARPAGTLLDVPGLVLARGRSCPERVALIAEGVAMTYGELDRLSSELAADLRSLVRAEPGAHVAVCLPRSVDTVVAILGVLRAGLAYVPLDPGYPRDRLAYICGDADVVALVTRSDLRGALPAVDVPTILVDQPAVAPHPAAAVGKTTIAGDQCAYTIYTSGSTGRPKGVRVSHRNVVTFLEAVRREPGLDEHDVLLAVTSPSFDISVLEMLLPLVAGAAVVVAGPQDVADGARLAALIDQHAVTVLQATPSTWRLLLDSGWAGRPGLRALCGGEAFPPALAADLLVRCAQVWNMYGPTETTVWSAVHRVSDADVENGVVPLGHPIAGTTAFVLDQGLTPVPPGTFGELCLGGDGVSLGYHRRPALTAERFVEAPLWPGHSLYRTGDLVRTRPDGCLQFAGRLDSQVKVRGFRVELSEIEAVLERSPAVARAVAVARAEPSGGTGVIAFVEPAAGAAPAPGALMELLRSVLPDYMVPSRIVALEALPLTPNGKVDRNRLPAPNADDTAVGFDGDGGPGQAGHVAPSTPQERAMAQIWEDLLDVRDVGVHDSFFELGGHSLLATKLIFRVRDVFGVDLPLQTIFEGEPSIARLVGLLTGDAGPESRGAEKPLDLVAEARLDPDIQLPPHAHRHSVRHPQHPLCTGTTGFVGAFLLAELLRETEAIAFCLVRAPSVADGHRRIRETLTGYGIWDPAFADRILPVLGTLDRPRLGVGRAQWQHLAAMVDVIYHCGAEVNFLRPYQALKAANVLSTQDLLRLACDETVKPVHFVSTTYVFSRFSYPPGTEFLEDMQPVHDLEHTFGYTQSKWVSEQMVLEAGRRGLPVYIYRAGRVAGHSLTGACQTYDFVWRATKVGIEMGVAPVMNMILDITPVDYVVAAMVHLSRQPELQGQAFHLVSKDPMPEADFVAWVERYGYVAERLTFGEWCSRVVERAADLSDGTAGALAPFLAGTLPLDRIPAASFDDRHVVGGLAGTSITCPAIDDRLLTLYFDYFVGAGFLPPPPVRTPAPALGSAP